MPRENRASAVSLKRARGPKRELQNGARGTTMGRPRRRGRKSDCTWTICTVDLASRRATPTHTSLRAQRVACVVHLSCTHVHVYTHARDTRERVLQSPARSLVRLLVQVDRAHRTRRTHTRRGWIAHNYPLSDTEIYVRVPRAHVTNGRSAP